MSNDRISDFTLQVAPTLREDEQPNWSSLPIEYFQFEEDFVEENMRCIPMLVRFKMDMAGVKLKLSDWSKFSGSEKKELALRPIGNHAEIAIYKKRLLALIYEHSGNTATLLETPLYPDWANINNIPIMIIEKSKEFAWEISISQWSALTTLQRFALLKLCRPGHENRNFPIAMREFGIVSSEW